MAFIRGPQQSFVDRRDYFDNLLLYANAHQHAGKPYIGEYHDELTGAWLITGAKAERSRYYNHSTFADLVIGGLIGIVPRDDAILELDPLLPGEAWDWFCLDGVPYHGHTLTIIWDRDGEHFRRGAGFSVWVDRKQLASSPALDRLTVKLPEKQGE